LRRPINLYKMQTFMTKGCAGICARVTPDGKML
jgi:hypothetical protein